jgi:hypothetical protein
MSNVVSINSRRVKGEPRTATEMFQEVKDILTKEPSTEPPAETQSRLLGELDDLSSDILLRKLQLIHRKQAEYRKWTAQEEEMAAELEAAAYLAYRHGVPEEAIYDLNDEALSNALQSAMTKVASA